jgi:Zn-dependent peptidase ImmA (M78 family)
MQKKVYDIASREAARARKGQGNPFSIDVVEVVLSYGIELKTWRFSSDARGLYLRAPNHRPCILVDISPSRLPADIRYTIAHEIGHHIYAERIGLSEAYYLDCGYQSNSIEETAAYVYADELLLPEDLLKKRVLQYTHNARRAIEIAATTFSVSDYRAGIRLRELKLIGVNEDEY